MAKNKWRWPFTFTVIVFIWWLFETVFHLNSFCFFKATSGIPCPGCGMTRAFLSLLSGDVTQAFYWHPLWPMVILAPLGLYYQHVKPSAPMNRWVIGLIAFVLLIHGYRMFEYFPSHAPMDFNHSALIPRVIGYLKTHF